MKNLTRPVATIGVAACILSGCASLPAEDQCLQRAERSGIVLGERRVADDELIFVISRDLSESAVELRKWLTPAGHGVVSCRLVNGRLDGFYGETGRLD